MSEVEGDEEPQRRRIDRYQELFERSDDAILIIEGEVFVDCNQAAVDMLRCSSRDEVLATHPSDISPPTQPDGQDSFAKANAMIALARKNGSHRFEWNHLRHDGVVIPVEVLLTSVESGDVPSLHVVWRDISERLALEEQLRKSQRMEAIGELAGGIAHDFNNVLVTILGHSGLIEDSSTEPQTLESASEISKAGERAEKLIQQLMSFSRHRPVSMEVVKLRPALLDLKPLLTRLIGTEIRLEIHAESDCPVFINPSQIDQVVLNLATNARDAMAGGGVLIFTLKAIKLNSGTLGKGHYVEMIVSDTGRGMDASELCQAFDPFFTTKAVGEGTGFGLSTVYKIARECGGDASIESAPGKGTSVRVLFPLTERGTSKCSSGHPNCCGAESILLIEDDLPVAKLVERYLERDGYTVLRAGTGAEALALMAKRDGEAIDLIVSDVMMPQMTGPESVRKLRERGCDSPVLFISGYTDDALALLRGQSVDLLPKPFTPEQLAVRVRRALDEVKRE